MRHSHFRLSNSYQNDTKQQVKGTLIILIAENYISDSKHLKPFITSAIATQSTHTHTGNMCAAIIRKLVSTPKAAKVNAPYNQAVVFDRIVFLSGVIGMDINKKIVPGGVVEETRQALKNIGYILEASGSSYEKVLKNTVFLADINDFKAVNDVYKEFFKEDFPARSAFQVAKLPLGAKVEIEVIAGTGDVKTIPTSKI